MTNQTAAAAAPQSDDLSLTQAADVPWQPRAVSEVGIRQTILEDLALKMLYLFGPFSVRDLSQHMRLSLEVADELFRRMRAGQLCEVTGMQANIASIAITSQGRGRALELLSLSQYAGATPVSMESYAEQVRRQSVRNVVVHAPHVERAFRHLVLDSETLRRIGTALNSGTSIFLYGPSGTGKTTMAETLSRVLAEDEVWVPHAVEVDGQIISVHDPLVHKDSSQPQPPNVDQRWVRCHRPTVVVGGELTIEMLDLQFNALSKFYTGPIQMKANNGVLIIDDFGRQRLTPEELLNRWVVPLDRRIDFLTLAGGKKVEIPFEMLVVFATNIDPAKLADAAFLRRIQSKIQIGAVDDDQFFRIFQRVAEERGMGCDADLVKDVIAAIRTKYHEQLRPCYPRDIVNQICWAAQYEDRKPHFDRDAVMRAVETYFLEDTEENHGVKRIN